MDKEIKYNGMSFNATAVAGMKYEDFRRAHEYPHFAAYLPEAREVHLKKVYELAQKAAGKAKDVEVKQPAKEEKKGGGK